MKPRKRGRLTRFLRTGHHRSPRASALIVSLAFVVLIAILVVGFATTSRLERDIVESHSAKLQAGLLNEMAVRVAQARLQSGTTNTANSTWLSQPGRITTVSGNTNEFFDLSSGASTNATQDVSVDLNPPPLLNSERAISGNFSVSMPVKWIYVRQDGSLILDPSAAPTYDADNPIVGRFAFWTDDLSARINLNTATAASATNPPTASWPGRQSLTALTNLQAADIAALKSYRTTNHFESARDALRATTNSPTLHAALSNQKFDVTHFSHSPSSLNVFGEPKIVLTTKAYRTNGTGSTNFFDILTSPAADPGLNASIDAVKFNALFHKLLNTYMRRTDWPLMPGKSFVQKYGNQAAAQIVLNLIDYVRSAEAEKLIVEPSRGHFDGGSIFAYGAAGPTIIGNTRRFYITQMGVWISDPDPTGACDIRVYTEVFLPKSAGDATTELDLLEGNRQIICHIGYNGSVLAFPKNGNDVSISTGDIRGGSGPLASRARMKPGEFRTIMIPYGPTATNFVRPIGNLDIRNTIRAAGLPNNSIDFAPLPFDYSPGSMVTYPLNPPGILPNLAQTSINTVGVNDPTINKAHGDWAQTSANTLGLNGKNTTPRSTLGQSPSGVPQQDTDASGMLTDGRLTNENVGIRVPAFKGTSNNPDGMVQSLGELGRIHTGNMGTANGGVPWRTLRIQPRVSSDNSLPDWLLLDLFTVPVANSGVTAADADLIHPSPSTIAGRVNVNAHIFPTNWAITNRTAPLLSALTANVTGSPLPNPQAAATNIFEGTLAIGSNPGRWYGSASFTNTRLFFLPEQIAEIKDVADGGEISEARLANILPFLTTRSSAFAVYSVGQKIRQLKSGVIKVLGESRSMTLLERLDNGTFREHSTTDLGL